MFRLFHLSFALLILSSITCVALPAQQWDDIDDEEYCEPSVFNRRRVYIGPEIYHLKRSRAGGTHQNGWMYGVRAGYDKVQKCTVYWGIDALYAKGTLHGKTGKGSKIKSRFTDENIEGRAGFTFQGNCLMRASFTPFIGIGYFSEKNNFVDPSPIPVHFNTRFGYGVVGFLSNLPWTERFETGLNFKARYPFEPRCRISHDPENDDTTLNVKEKWQFRVELPITYNCTCCDLFALTLSPFYEYRLYGKHLNFPSNFLRTQYQIYGITFEFVLRI